LTKLQAELYALTHRGNPGDRSFYANTCAKAGRILELGTGYGRLIPDLIGGGSRFDIAKELWGLERDPELLAAARVVVRQLGPAQRSHVKLLIGDIREFELKQLFDRIILPYNGLYCLKNRRDILSCFKCVKRQLAPRGEFIFDVWNADPFHRDARSSARMRGASRIHSDEPGPIVSIAHGSQVWDVFEKSRLRSRLQRLDVTYTYVSQERGTSVVIPIEQRYAPSGELIERVTSAGFRIKAIYGDFSRCSFGRNSPHLVIRAI